MVRSVALLSFARHAWRAMRHCLLQTNVKRSREAKLCTLRGGYLGFLPCFSQCQLRVHLREIQLVPALLAYGFWAHCPVERPSPVWAEREFKLAPRVPTRGANSSLIAREHDRRQRRSWSRVVFELSPYHR